ncbi:MAG: LysM peptidoglycan-binding domain-containing protein [Elusimicrobia bacterium]|nr:LysM peptidoglycan-binding domain-containing protein [Elusimicrobiota bacterium]
MAYRLTRLQAIYLIIVFFIVFGICKKFYRSWQDSNSNRDVIVEQQSPVEAKEDIEKERLRKIEQNAKQQIAVCGEKIRLKRQQGVDVTPAVVVLKKAKNAYDLSDFENAIAYARESSNIVDALTLTVLPPVYVVKKGDNLWGISKKYYKKGSNWYNIWKTNKEKISDFDKIYRGQKIVIPNTSQKNQS